jgi:hypothetical protein
MVSESSIKAFYDYLDGARAIMPPFDDIVLAGILITLMLGGMRLLYGSWPWEASKTWYRTRQAVDYVEGLRAEIKSNPVVPPVQDVIDAGAPSEVSDTVDTSILRKLLNTVDLTSDSFDRSVALDDSAAEVASQSPVTVSTSARRDRRAWRKISRRKQPNQVAQIGSLSNNADQGESAPSTRALESAFGSDLP